MALDDSNSKTAIGVIVTISIIAIFAFVFLNIGDTMGNVLGTDNTIAGGGIANGDFEGGNADGWTEYTENGTISVSAGAAHSGSYGLNMTVDSRT
jgi:hypothetical protein